MACLRVKRLASKFMLFDVLQMSSEYTLVGHCKIQLGLHAAHLKLLRERL